MNLEDRLREQREDILVLETKYAVHNVRVFGSVAWTKASVNSDVDLLIGMKRGLSIHKIL
jgi:predicted nucleotidyltransferase